jgi:phage tail-like protein
MDETKPLPSAEEPAGTEAGPPTPPAPGRLPPEAPAGAKAGPPTPPAPSRLPPEAPAGAEVEGPPVPPPPSRLQSEAPAGAEAGGPPVPPPPSRLLQYLPAIYQESDFMGRFLRIFEDQLLPVEDILGQLPYYFDPRLTPPSFLPWLASWIDLALDENWPEERRRELIHRGTDLYRWRGTRRGLLTYLRIYAGVEPQIEEHLAAADGGPFRFTVVLRVADPTAVDETRVRAIIEAEKPAHTTYALRIAKM